MKFKKLLTLPLFFILAHTIAHGESPAIMPLSEIKPGMKGICKTIFEGPKIEEFNVEVIELMRNIVPHSDVLLVRLSGPNVDKTGVVSGMSGSPVYIDGKLAGALCYRFGVFQKEPLGGVMPIEQMLDLIDKEKYYEHERLAVKSAPNFPLQAALLHEERGSETALINWTLQNVSAPVYNPQLSPIKIPLMFSGFHPRIVENHKSLFERYGFQVITGSSSTGIPEERAAPMLQPGSAISGVLVDGDLSVTATGTVTYRNGNEILAFGHPFLGYGPINLPMAHSKILTTMSSLYYSYKMAEVTEILGVFHQDRHPGVMGIIGEKADMFPVTVNYQSPFGAAQTFSFTVAKDRSVHSFTPILLWMGLLSVMESARMSQSDYHTYLTGEIGIKDHDAIKFDDFYGGGFNEDDISQSTLNVVLKAAAVLLNQFKTPDIQYITLNYDCKPGKKAAEITHVWYDQSNVKPGDIVNLLIFVQPHQCEPVKISHKFRIPDKIETGRFSLFVGSRDYVDRLEQRLAPGRFNPQNLDQLIELLNQKRKNNSLIIQLRQVAPGTILKGQEFTSLPPSILMIMDSKKTSDKMNVLRDQLVEEVSLPMEWMLNDGKMIPLLIREK
ncbi:hypothetical protein JXJ21_11720 [candidate division KSB1 bacterium]|nr:hypothetical protein [candidate division KSB1 bacterium]